jgi:hypothetical protein
MVFGKKRKTLPPFQPPPSSSSPPPQPRQQSNNNTREQSQNKTKYFTIQAKSILDKEISIDDLAEPYVIIESRKENMGEIGYVINILARQKGYRVVAFSMTRFFACVIVEKQ